MLINCTHIRFSGETRARMLASPQFENGRVPTVPTMTGNKHGSSLAEYFCGNKNLRTPNVPLPRKRADLAHFVKIERDQLNVTWLGHSSLMINIGGYRVMTDPVFEKKVSIVGPTRFDGEVPLDPSELPSIDTVVISHDHYDHLSKHAIRLLAKKTRRFVAPLGVGTRLRNWGVPRDQIIELDWWEEFHLGKLTFAATPGQHFSGRRLTDRNKTLWASWVIKTDRHRVFFSGDSGYFDGFKKIGDRYGPFDITFIECGAYNDSWRNVHMFPEQTVQAHLDLRGEVLHPIHWGTFNLSLHPWYEPMERLSKAALNRSVQVTTPIVGDTTVLGRELHTRRWWRVGNGKHLENVTNKTETKGN